MNEPEPFKSATRLNEKRKSTFPAKGWKLPSKLFSRISLNQKQNT